MKYIRVGYNDSIILFPSYYNHATFVNTMGLDKKEIVSAGFVRLVTECNPSFKNPGFECYGKSWSLQMGSLSEDSKILNKQLYGSQYES